MLKLQDRKEFMDSKAKTDLQQHLFWTIERDELAGWLGDLVRSEQLEVAKVIVKQFFVRKNIPAILKYCAEVIEPQ